MSPSSRSLGRLLTWASFVKFEHTLFSLPMLYAGAVLAAGGVPDLPVLGWILGAGTGARTAGFGLNRIIDRRIDARNPRTAGRELPAGTMGLAEAWGVVAAGLVLYIGSCAMLPPICLILSPIPVAAFAIYPYLKRFTSLAHLGVGLTLSFAPLGGWLAVEGRLEHTGPALLLGAFTLAWVAGFDIIYATLDRDFDRREGLHSLPARLGNRSALHIARGLHLLAVGALLALYVLELAGTLAVIGLVLVAGVLVVEHRLAEQVDLAFFHLNVVVGFLVFGIILAGRAGW